MKFDVAHFIAFAVPVSKGDPWKNISDKYIRTLPKVTGNRKETVTFVMSSGYARPISVSSSVVSNPP